MTDKIANDFEAIARRMREISGTDQKDLNEANLKEVIDRVAENPGAFGLVPTKGEGEPRSIDRTLGVDQAGNAAGVNDLFDQSFDNLTNTTTATVSGWTDGTLLHYRVKLANGHTYSIGFDGRQVVTVTKRPNQAAWTADAEK